jgi:hypothetical protein
MAMIILFTVLLLAGPAAILFGESRYDDRDRRGWWPGSPRQR